MSQGPESPRGGFRAPRVPFDLRCVLLAAGGYLVVTGIDWLLAKAWSVASPVAQMGALLIDQLDHVAFIGAAFRRATEPVWGYEPHALAWWQSLATAFLFFAVWSLFGAAVLRCSALRLTRDEPLGLTDALKFGGKNLVGFLLAPVLVIAFAFFFSCCNALAGLIMSIPLLGSSILAIVLFPLVLVSSLLIVLAVMGGVVGLPLMWAGISVEQNGPLEALSRTFSYIFARPFRFFFVYFLLFVLMSLIMLAHNHFERTVKGTLQAGVVRQKLEDSISKPPGEVRVLEDAHRNAEKVKRQDEGIANIRNILDASGWDMVGIFFMWLFLNVFLLGFKGYALYFMLGGTVSLYLHLRREVDGTEEEEIYPESEEEMAQEEPRWVQEGGDEPQPESGSESEEPKA